MVFYSSLPTHGNVTVTEYPIIAGLEYGIENAKIFHVGLHQSDMAGRILLLLVLPVVGRVNRKGGKQQIGWQPVTTMMFNLNHIQGTEKLLLPNNFPKQQIPPGVLTSDCYK